MADKKIYGEHTGDDGAGDAISEAMKDLGSSFSNKINGPVSDSRVAKIDSTSAMEGEKA